MCRLVTIPCVFIFVLVLTCVQAQASDSTTVVDPLLTSNLHVWKGYRYLDLGDEQMATKEFVTATSTLRTLPDPHFGLAKIYGGTSGVDAFLEFATGIKLMLTDFFYQSLLAANLAVIGLLAFSLAIYIGVLVVVVRHLRIFYLSAAATLSSHIGLGYAKPVLLAMILSTLIILSAKSPIGILTWTLVLGGGAVWRYASPSERKVMVTFLIFLALFSQGLTWCSRLVAIHHPSSTLRLAALADKTTNQAFGNALNTKTRALPYDPLNALIRGLYHLRKGENYNAIQYFQLARKFDPHNAAVYNNLAIAYCNLGDYYRAVHLARQALQYAPREAVVHYNYALILNQLFRYDLAEEELSKAYSLDFNLTRALMVQEPKPTPQPMNLQARSLWRLFTSEKYPPFTIDYHPTEAGPLGIVALAIGTIVLLGFSHRLLIPATCDICGAFLPYAAKLRRKKDAVCSECASIRKEVGEDIDAFEEKIDKKLERMRVRRFVRKLILSILVPGLSYHLCGQRLKGVWVSLILFSLIIVAVNGWIIKTVPALPVPAGSTSKVILIIAYVIYVWRSILLVIRTEVQGSES